MGPKIYLDDELKSELRENNLLAHWQSKGGGWGTLFWLINAIIRAAMLPLLAVCRVGVGRNVFGLWSLVVFYILMCINSSLCFSEPEGLFAQVVRIYSTILNPKIFWETDIVTFLFTIIIILIVVLQKVAEQIPGKRVSPDSRGASHLFKIKNRWKGEIDAEGLIQRIGEPIIFAVAGVFIMEYLSNLMPIGIALVGSAAAVFLSENKAFIQARRLA